MYAHRRTHLEGRRRLERSPFRRRKKTLGGAEAEGLDVLICGNTFLKINPVNISFLRCSMEKDSVSMKCHIHRLARVQTVKAPSSPAGKKVVPWTL